MSIAILNYQRRDALRRALESARSQRFPVEILAVDNGSTDGSADMVRDEFPDVRLVRLPDNIAAAARNVGVATAKGDIVFTLDNDVLLSTSDDVARGLEVFQRHPRAAIVSFTIVGADDAICRRDWCHPRDPDEWGEHEFPTDYVLEGASACRREAFLASGGYWPPLFIGRWLASRAHERSVDVEQHELRAAAHPRVRSRPVMMLRKMPNQLNSGTVPSTSQVTSVRCCI